jgi:hypothetical protein
MKEMEAWERNEITLILQNAEAFLYVGTLSFLQFSDLVNAGKFRDCDSSYISCAATNVTFAIELYLKGLCRIIGISVGKEHNLKLIFDMLPDNIQADITTFYSNTEPTSKFYPEAFLISNKKGFGLAKVDFQSESNPVEVLSVIEKHKTGFINWRYSHENNDKVELYIDLNSLRRLSEALSATIDKNLPLNGLCRIED